MYNETKEHKFFCLMRDFTFYDFLVSSLRRGKPSRYLLGTSKLLHKFKEKEELLECAEKDMKRTAKELYEFLKEEKKIKAF